MTVKASLSDPSLLVERMLIAGEANTARSGATLTVENPANGAIVGTVPAGDAADARVAIDAAAAALGPWRRRTAGDRAAILERWNDLILANIADLGRIMTAEQGKPIAEAEGEIRYAATFVKWFAEEGRRIGGHDVPAPTADRRILALKEPVGVCAAITPWNFPAAMITRKCAPALAAGCTVVIKPSELTPFTALALVVLAERAGVPAGVLNVVTGMPHDIGAEITANEAVRKISFTGSTRVGALLMRQSADSIKRLSLELGGNAPFLVFDDADIDMAVAGAMASKFRNAGQTCVCANRILVQSGIHDRFVAKLGEGGSRRCAWRTGAIRRRRSAPLINAAATEKVAAHLADALAGGGDHRSDRRLRAGRNPLFPPGAADGCDHGRCGWRTRRRSGRLLPSSVSTTRQRPSPSPTPRRSAWPVTSTRDNLHRAWRVAEALDFGMVGLNTGSIAMEMAPFGGVKQSGLGREGGRAGIEEYLETKAFHWGGLKAW